MSENERERGREFADKLTLGVLTRAWQILLKGVEDVKDSPRPLASAEMALIRLAYASDLPAPEEALRKLAESTDGPRHAPPLPPAGAGPRASMRLAAAGARSARGRAPPFAARGGPSARLASRTSLRWRAPSATFSSSSRSSGTCGSRASNTGSIAFTPVEGASSGLAQTLARRLQEWTGERWMVALVAGSTAPTLREAAEARDAERASGAGGASAGAQGARPIPGRPDRRRPGARARAGPAGASSRR